MWRMAQKILVVEDNTMLADVYLMKLQDDHGYEVKVALDGHQALRTIQSWQPDLVILDLMMPDVDGFEVLQQMHTQGLTQKIPVIVATQLKDTDSINKALQYGARDYFAKSDVLTEDIVKQVQDILKTT